MHYSNRRKNDIKEEYNYACKCIEVYNNEMKCVCMCVCVCVCITVHSAIIAFAGHSLANPITGVIVG